MAAYACSLVMIRIKAIPLRGRSVGLGFDGHFGIIADISVIVNIFH
jgi:hypothetical protein